MQNQKMVSSHFHPSTTFSLAVVNSWFIYQEVGGRGNLLDFFINISCCLMNNNDSNDFDPEPVAKRRASVKANQVPNEIHQDKTDHWPL